MARAWDSASRCHRLVLRRCQTSHSRTSIDFTRKRGQLGLWCIQRFLRLVRRRAPASHPSQRPGQLRGTSDTSKRAHNSKCCEEVGARRCGSGASSGVNTGVLRARFSGRRTAEGRESIAPAPSPLFPPSSSSSSTTSLAFLLAKTVGEKDGRIMVLPQQRKQQEAGLHRRIGGPQQRN